MLFVICEINAILFLFWTHQNICEIFPIRSTTNARDLFVVICSIVFRIISSTYQFVIFALRVCIITNNLLEVMCWLSFSDF